MAIRRNTIQRALVLDAVRTLKNHPTPDMVCEHVRKHNPAVSRSTVYRNINLLCKEGHLLRVQVPNSADHIDHRCDPHYHVSCRRCGCVFDAELKEGQPLSGDPNCLCNSVSSRECSIEGCFLLFTGICNECFAAKNQNKKD